MPRKLDGALLRNHGAALRGLRIKPGRAEEIAAEVTRQTGAVMDAKVRLEFNDEPARFLTALHLHRERKA